MSSMRSLLNEALLYSLRSTMYLYLADLLMQNTVVFVDQCDGTCILHDVGPERYLSCLRIC